LDNANGKITELTTRNKNFEEKYKQLEARITVQPSNNFPAPQGSILGIKVVINQIFRDTLQLKDQKQFMQMSLLIYLKISMLG
jgi:hypothetical protein